MNADRFSRLNAFSALVSWKRGAVVPRPLGQDVVRRLRVLGVLRRVVRDLPAVVLVVEVDRVGHVVPGEDVPLQLEQVLRVADVAAQLVAASSLNGFTTPGKAFM